MIERNLRIEWETESVQNNCPVRQYFGNNVYDKDIILHPNEKCDGSKHRLVSFAKSGQGNGSFIQLTPEMIRSCNTEDEKSSLISNIRSGSIMIFDELDEVMKWDDKEFYRRFMTILREILQAGGWFMCYLNSPDNEIDELYQDPQLYIN